MELLIDLEAVLVTRRFFNTLMDACHVIVRCQLSPLAARGDLPEGKLFGQLLDMLRFYGDFEIDDFTGEPCTEQQMYCSDVCVCAKRL